MNVARLKKTFKIDASLFTALTLFYFEIITRLLTCEVFFDIGLIFIAIFSVTAGLLIGAAAGFMKEKAAKLFTAICICVMAVIHITQIIYHSVFNKYLIFYSLTAGGVGNVLEGGILKTTLKSILGGIPAMLAFCVPIFLVFRFGGKNILFKRKKWWGLLFRFAPAVALYLSAVLIAGAVSELGTIQ